jgi:hypothetical protein
MQLLYWPSYTPLNNANKQNKLRGLSPLANYTNTFYPQK